jgi:predicted nucleic acid-binding protein
MFFPGAPPELYPKEKFPARDAIHIATMHHMKVRSILSFDPDFRSPAGQHNVLAMSGND